MNLYEIDKAIEDAFTAAVDQETGEVDEEKLAVLDQLEMDRTTKLENVACYIKNLRADAEAYKAEKDAFAKRQKAAENRVAYLSRYLSEYLNGEKFTTDRCAVTFRKSSRVVLDAGKTVYDIDTHYLRTAEPVLDKTAIAKALKAGEVIEGVHEEETVSMTVK